MFRRSLLWAVLAWAALPDMAAAGEQLRVGRAAVDITPAPGTPMLTPQRPPFEIKLAAEPHDPLHVKAIVLDQGGVRAALVSCDLTSLPLRIHREARRLIGESTAIDPAAVLINATHTHTAPQIRPQYLGKADEAARRKAAEYTSALPAKIAEAVRLAEADLQPATVAAAVGHEESVSFNRRFFLRDGTVQANPFKEESQRLNEIARAAGPIDPEVGVQVFRDAHLQPLAVMVNFSIHFDTMGGEQPSADLGFTVEKLLQEVCGPQTLVFWASGASGNINHYDLLDPTRFRREKGAHESARIGTILAAEVLRSFRRLEPMREAPLKTGRQVVRLDYHPDKSQSLIARMKDAPQFFDGEVDVFSAEGHVTFEAEVQVVTLGNELAWVGLPGEMFVELGMNLKNSSPFRYTFVHSLANGAIGYVPNRRAYPEGAREVLSTRCAPGSGERLVEAAVALLTQLKQSE